MYSNELSSLPAGVFEGLSSLQGLYLNSNQLSSLPAGVFEGLSSLNYLELGGNQLSSLPAGVFDNLSNLNYLYLNDNQLSSLPAGVFDNLSNLNYLSVYYNNLCESKIDSNTRDRLNNLNWWWQDYQDCVPEPIENTMQITVTSDYSEVQSWDTVHYTTTVKNTSQETKGIGVINLVVSKIDPLPSFDLDLWSGTVSDFSLLIQTQLPMLVSNDDMIAATSWLSYTDFSTNLGSSQGQCLPMGQNDLSYFGKPIFICEVYLAWGASLSFSYDLLIDYAGLSYGDNIYAFSYVGTMGVVDTITMDMIEYDSNIAPGKVSDTVVTYVEKRSTPSWWSSWRGGWWYSVPKDNCPDWDMSGDRYDGTCKKEDTLATTWGDQTSQAIQNPELWVCFTPHTKTTTYQYNNVTEVFRQAHAMIYRYDITTIAGTLDYRPYDYLTRQETAKMLVKFAINVLCKTPINIYDNTFRDIDMVNSNLQNDVRLSYEYGLFRGHADGTFRPYDVMSEDDIARVLWRLLSTTNVEDSVSIYQWIVKKYTDKAISTRRWWFVELLYDIYQNYP